MLNNFGYMVGGPNYLINLDVEELIESSISSSNLDDFYDLEWLSSFNQRVEILKNSNLHLRGLIHHKSNLLTMLRNRLFVTRRIKDNNLIL